MGGRVRLFCLSVSSLAAAGFALSANAGPLTASQQSQLHRFLSEAQSQMPAPPAPQANTVALEAAARAIVGADGTVPTAASQSTDDTSPAAPPSDIVSILGLGAPPVQTATLTKGLSTGGSMMPPLPVMVNFDHETAMAMLDAFSTPSGSAVDARAQQAAAEVSSGDVAMDERIGLAKALFHIDGTEALLRSYVATEHMKLIIGEVANHIDFSKLSESDTYRLSAIAAQAQTELQDKIILLNARVQAQTLTKPELIQLLAAMDTDAQRKQTALRLADDGTVDREAELDIRLAELQIVKAFESKH